LRQNLSVDGIRNARGANLSPMSRQPLKTRQDVGFFLGKKYQADMLSGYGVPVVVGCSTTGN
jgi:hypothetical protein